MQPRVGTGVIVGILLDLSTASLSSFVDMRVESRLHNSPPCHFCQPDPPPPPNCPDLLDTSAVGFAFPICAYPDWHQQQCSTLGSPLRIRYYYPRNCSTSISMF
ncbi:hypothetical protein BKA82DRAFT_883995 [Pisolithus tinctorius]|uniref:Uncharacterized protein n=1 Tax=Pisolithus tinctorius Marx 270 TaxID=870435 RepID=A0A0C3PQY5_PISTI|nr:hypothetical protein BKA82DRAFT_883995 [Pisolithus tinctorius]KIO10964.1 hypothetical protein M404DRAFT_883995 [Pisolithus tinctorius Marx 270]